MAIDAPPRFDLPRPDTDTPNLPRVLHEEFAEQPLLFRRMSYDEFLQLPEKPKAEWLDGIAVIRMAPALPVHSLRNSRLDRVLAASLPSLEVISECAIWLAGKEFVPDIIALEPEKYDPTRIEDPPIIAVEILSSSTRKYDLTVKADAYRIAGIQQYWTMDTAIGEIIVRENCDDHWEVTTTLDFDHPEVTINVGSHGGVLLNRDQLFG